VVIFLLVVATVVDGALAAVVWRSGFWFGGGPESMHASALAAVAFIAAVAACPRGGRLAAGRGSTVGAYDASPVLGRGYESVRSVLAFDRSHPRIGQVEADKFRSVAGESIQ